MTFEKFEELPTDFKFGKCLLCLKFEKLSLPYVPKNVYT